MGQLDDFTYVVGLAPGKTSFYDPVSKCNLFKSRPVFGFNIEPTTDILRGLKGGVLVDIKGNLKPSDTIKPAAAPAVQQAQVPPQQPPAQPPVPPAVPPVQPPVNQDPPPAPAGDGVENPEASADGTPADGTEGQKPGGNKKK
jgi:hypothetical protein